MELLYIEKIEGIFKHSEFLFFAKDNVCFCLVEFRNLRIAYSGRATVGAGGVGKKHDPALFGKVFQKFI